MLPSKDSFIEDAQSQTGLTDFGDPWMLDHLDPLIKAIEATAKLNPEGVYGATQMITGALAKRLQHIQLFKDHPDIHEQEVHVAAILSGLPRTGSTMLHRMLASAPSLTAMRWFETQNYLPFPGEEPGNPAPRIEAAEGILAYMLEKIPELLSIHPMSVRQPDEEVIVLGQLFSSSMIESTYFVPDYADWLSEQDPTKAYEDLIDILKILQWQDKTREGKQWVLKTPGHLMSMSTVLDVFPNARIINTHRDPVNTVPSYCSMMDALYRMGSDEIDRKELGAFWVKRLGHWLESYQITRDASDASRFMDIDYLRLLKHPIDVGREVLDFAGLPLSPDIEAGMEEWIEANRREHRAPHKYALEDFGLTEDQILSDFEDYSATYL